MIYCAGKSVSQLKDIYGLFQSRKENLMGTRASREQYEALKAQIPDLIYDEDARICGWNTKTVKSGCVAVLTGGTSDLHVAEEAAVTAEYSDAA